MSKNFSKKIRNFEAIFNFMINFDVMIQKKIISKSFEIFFIIFKNFQSKIKHYFIKRGKNKFFFNLTT